MTYPFDLMDFGRRAWLRIALVLSSAFFVSAATAQQVKVCVSSTDVGAIVQAVGGDAVTVTGFVKGPDDPHVVHATRRMIESLASADLLVIVGNGLEEGWLPDMLAQARKPELKPGGKHHLDLSENLRTIVGPEGRGVPGSFHPEDNPHFLVDAVEAVKAAAAVADRLADLSPSQAQVFESNYRKFAAAVMTEMLGGDLASLHSAEEFEEIAIAIELGKLAEHLEEKGNSDVKLGGQLAKFEAFRDTPVVGDHDMWPYFARRYGIRVLGYLEPEPGLPPTTSHLQGVIKKMKERNAGVILTVPYFDPRHAKFVSGATGSVAVPMAHCPQSRPGTDSYLEMLRYNAQVLFQALESSAGAP